MKRSTGESAGCRPVRRAYRTGSARAVVGLLGGIGAGKSTVAGLFAALGAEVVSADAIVHRHLARAAVRARIRAALGIALPADVPGFKAALARVIFSVAAARRAVERVLHPLVEAAIARHVRRAGKGAVIVLDVPLLLEARMQRRCDALAFVHAPAAVRVARAAEARGWNAAELRARERCQAPLRRKRTLSRWRIDNGRSIAATRRQVAKIWRELTNQHE